MYRSNRQVAVIAYMFSFCFRYRYFVFKLSSDIDIIDTLHHRYHRYVNMADFITEYSIGMKVSNANMIGAVLGKSGEIKHYIEFKTGCKLDIDRNEGTVKISGKSVDVVEKAKVLVWDKMSAFTFSVNIHNGVAEKILGIKGDTIRKLREDTGAHIKLSPLIPGEDTRNMQICGIPETVKNAKSNIFDIIEEEISQNFKEPPSNPFREKSLKKGWQSAKYRKGQEAPTPQKIFIEFESELIEGESKFVASNMRKEGSPPSPKSINANSSVLAPFEGLYYRAKILNYCRDKSDILSVLVLFVDFGNMEWVNFFDLKYLQAKYRYPPLATLCQIANIRPQLWNEDNLYVFRQELNNTTKTVNVKVYDDHRTSDDIIKIELEVQNVGNIGDYLVKLDYAEWVDDHTIPSNQERIESSDSIVPVLYVVSPPPPQPPVHAAGFGFGSNVKIHVFMRGSEKFTATYQFKKASFQRSMKSAYKCAQKILTDQHNNFLDHHSLHFSTDTNIDLYEGSAGCALAVGILSVALKFKIPDNIAVTGTIEENGDVGPVGSIRDKLLAAYELQKTILYVPRENKNEAGISSVGNITVKGIDSIFDVLNDIYSIADD